jgi:6-phosphogluconolactonase
MDWDRNSRARWAVFMSKFQLHQFSNAGELARSAARDWLREAEKQTSAKGRFCVALLGGRIAGTFFSSVAELVRKESRRLDGVEFFWSDERCVPPESPESNYAAARDRLLRPLRIAENRIHRTRGEMPPEKAAGEATAELLRFAPQNPDGQPVCDLVFLGMGPDGHVASLFPAESEEARSSAAVFRPVIGPKPPPQRITMGYPAIAAATQVWVLVSGDGKEEALGESLSPKGQTPLARVLNSRTNTRLFTDLALQGAPLHRPLRR